jgi:hypothetical protein
MNKLLRWSMEKEQSNERRENNGKSWKPQQ